MTRQKVRTLRHWRQRFDPNAEFVFRRPSTYGGVQYQPGDVIPDKLKAAKMRLQFMWRANRIELAEFETAPNGTPPDDTPPDDLLLPEGVTVERNSSWYDVTLADGTEQKVRGRDALEALLAQLWEGSDGD